MPVRWRFWPWPEKVTIIHKVVCYKKVCANNRRNFQVAFCLCFRASPGAKPFKWKLVLFTRKFWFIYLWINLISISKASHLDSLWNRGEMQLANRLLSVRPRDGFKVHKVMQCACASTMFNRISENTFFFLSIVWRQNLALKLVYYNWFLETSFGDIWTAPSNRRWYWNCLMWSKNLCRLKSSTNKSFQEVD